MSASTSPIPYTGNKSCIVKTILDVMPQHDTYIEENNSFLIQGQLFLAEKAPQKAESDRR